MLLDGVLSYLTRWTAISEILMIFSWQFCSWLIIAFIAGCELRLVLDASLVHASWRLKTWNCCSTRTTALWSCNGASFIFILFCLQNNLILLISLTSCLGQLYWTRKNMRKILFCKNLWTLIVLLYQKLYPAVGKFEKRSIHAKNYASCFNMFWSAKIYVYFLIWNLTLL